MNPKPWTIKPDTDRLVDNRFIFLIFCEDEVSEPVYLTYFETSKIKINFIRGNRSKMEHVLRAITHCEGEGLIEMADGKRKLVGDGIQVWCVFDRDKEAEIEHHALGNASFDESIRTANEIGLKVAWSNDAFELWILLHFEEIDPNIEENWSRGNYYQKLTQIFQTISNPNVDLVKALQSGHFDYKNSLKRNHNFRNIVRKEIVDKTEQAISRANQLEIFHSSTDKAPHLMSPCTMIHKLVRELIQIGG